MFGKDRIMNGCKCPLTGTCGDYDNSRICKNDRGVINVQETLECYEKHRDWLWKIADKIEEWVSE